MLLVIKFSNIIDNFFISTPCISLSLLYTTKVVSACPREPQEAQIWGRDFELHRVGHAQWNSEDSFAP